jgi:hypothetical protein
MFLTVACVMAAMASLAPPVGAQPGTAIGQAAGMFHAGTSWGWNGCDETGRGYPGGDFDQAADQGVFALHDVTLTQVPAPGPSGLVNTGTLNLCGDLSRDAADEAEQAIGAACEAAVGQSTYGRNGQGRLEYSYGDAYVQLRNVNWALTAASGIVARGQYESSPGTPLASSGTVLLYMHMGDGSPFANNCVLTGGGMSTAFTSLTVMQLIPNP